MHMKTLRTGADIVQRESEETQWLHKIILLRNPVELWSFYPEILLTVFDDTAEFSLSFNFPNFRGYSSEKRSIPPS